MDRISIKERAKQLIARNRGEMIVAALILTLCGGGASGLSGAFSAVFSDPSSASTEYYYNGNPVPDFSTESSFIMSSVLIILGLVITAVSVASLFLMAPLEVGAQRYILKARKNIQTGVGEVTGNFKDGNFLNIVKTMVCKDIFVFLWSLLFVIPGVIKAFEYMMIPFILAVRPDIDRKEAFRLSKVLTDGHKGDLFVLCLSFMGWQFVSAFTCGILAIVYVNPYMYASYAEAYSDLREEALRTGKITYEDLPDYMSFSEQQYYGFNEGFNGFNNGFNNPQNNYNQSGYAPFNGNGYGMNGGYAQNNYSQNYDPNTGMYKNVNTPPSDNSSTSEQSGYTPFSTPENTAQQNENDNGENGNGYDTTEQ